MRKFAFIALACVIALGLSYCSASRKAGKAAVPKTTFEGELAGVIAGNCSPCHIPSKGGNKKAYDDYENVRKDIDEMVRRIQLQPTDKGFMPFRKKEQLPAEVVAVFKKFRDDGALEK